MMDKDEKMEELRIRALIAEDKVARLTAELEEIKKQRDALMEELIWVKTHR